MYSFVAFWNQLLLLKPDHRIRRRSLFCTWALLRRPGRFAKLAEIGPAAFLCELFKSEGHSFCAEWRIGIGNVEVQVWAGRLPGKAKRRDHLPFFTD